MDARLFRTVALVSFALSCSATGGRPAGGADAHGLVGVHAPAFSRPAVSGATSLSTESARGRVLIVDFWATYCTPCAKEFPKLQALADKHAGALVVYGLSEDDATDGISAFVKKTGVRFPIGWDEKNAISQRYRLDKMPTSFIVDKRGIVRFVHGGYTDGEEEQIAREVEQLMR
jgi:cytochrome c biogenesis protein CcmG, thiol:disulfide interchange protein DsbE